MFCSIFPIERVAPGSALLFVNHIVSMSLDEDGVALSAVATRPFVVLMLLFEASIGPAVFVPS